MNCPNCNQQTGLPDWKARATYLWANQYGYCRRVFCDNCGQWSNVTTMYKGDLTTVRVVQYPTDKLWATNASTDKWVQP